MNVCVNVGGGNGGGGGGLLSVGVFARWCVLFVVVCGDLSIFAFVSCSWFVVVCCLVLFVVVLFWCRCVLLFVCVVARWCCSLCVVRCC